MEYHAFVVALGRLNAGFGFGHCREPGEQA
ncbi:hypothetical protein FHT01_001815 [Sphingomonas japonica]|uniref:Uncharacterized protein n=1 Tax=Sphingomonas japonica TaxID=511662 RepID=A0ABX0U662_9SPHN|nr:hypothetical protein [Sphingomonas japonica]